MTRAVPRVGSCFQYHCHGCDLLALLRIPPVLGGHGSLKIKILRWVHPCGAECFAWKVWAWSVMYHKQMYKQADGWMDG